MSAKFTDEQLAGLLDGIASGMPMGALAGIAGVSSPTLMNRLHNAGFLHRLVGVFDKYDAATVTMLERLEHWWNYPGEREVAYKLRQMVAKVLRDRFHDHDDAEQRAARRKGPLRRGGIDWRWSSTNKRWEYGTSNWWRGSISGQ